MLNKKIFPSTHPPLHLLLVFFDKGQIHVVLTSKIATTIKDEGCVMSTLFYPSAFTRDIKVGYGMSIILDIADFDNPFSLHFVYSFQSISRCGHPICFPSPLARSIPNFVRSINKSRSRSATHANIAIISSRTLLSTFLSFLSLSLFFNLRIPCGLPQVTLCSSVVVWLRG